MKKSHGFTLIELMITVAIVGIIAAIALPNYQNYVRKSHRIDAKSTLTGYAAKQELYFSQQGKYTTTIGNSGLGLSTVSEEGYYDITATACGGGTIEQCFNLIATAKPGTTQEKDSDCYKFIINSYGQKSALKKDGSTTTNCW